MSPTRHIQRGVTTLRAVRHALTAPLVLATACSGCGWSSQFKAPRRLPGIASATPLPPSFSQPPVEPPPAPAATVAIEPPPPQELPPVPASAVPDSGMKAEVESLRAELAQMKSRQESSQTALESLSTSSLAAANRAAAIEAHLALQSSLIDDLRNATQQQQREQWKALDAVSEGIDRMLKKSNLDQRPAQPGAEPQQTPQNGGHDPAPGDLPLQEILSQDPSATGDRGLR
ncbi:MAG TPA: hypothetical protein VM510_09475 [Caulifigura sp.]|nr:hypothetical protein [Caulifigura sp.]